MLITAIVVLLLAIALVVALVLGPDELAGVLYRCIGRVIAVGEAAAA
ncbi:hypothetical protein [Mesobacillus jeotgali]|nr:hypothetical protein [Mesobacillus jeotgali]